MLPSVANGRFDVAVAAIGTTDKRKQTVDFSDGYLAGYLRSSPGKDSGIKEATAWPASASAWSRARCRKSTRRRISRGDLVVSRTTIPRSRR